LSVIFLIYTRIPHGDSILAKLFWGAHLWNRTFSCCFREHIVHGTEGPSEIVNLCAPLSLTFFFYRRLYSSPKKKKPTLP